MFAAANDFRFDKRRADNSAYDIYQLTDPAWDTPTNPLLFGWNGSAYKTYQFDTTAGFMVVTGEIIQLDPDTMPTPTDVVTNYATQTYADNAATTAAAAVDISGKADKATTITAGTGLTGGGSLSANRTLALDSATIASLVKADSALQSIASGDVVTALGYTPYNGASNPNGYTSSTGTVTSVSVTSANGVSGSVANAGTTPAITITLGTITPSSVTASGSISGSNLSGTNTGDQTNITGNAGTVTTINGRISQGTNVTITGSGTSGSPYVVNATDTNSGGTVTSVGISSSTLTVSGNVTTSGSLTVDRVAIVQNDNVARSLNSNYTVSSTRRARLNYSINVSWSLAALLSGSGSAFLEYSSNGGSTWVTVSQVSKSIGLLTFTGADDLNLSGEIPANVLTRIRTSSTNMVIAYTRGQEILD